MYRFMREQGHDNYRDLHAWSIADRAEFWQALVDFCDVRFSRPPDAVLTEPGDMTTASWSGSAQR